MVAPGNHVANAVSTQWGHPAVECPVHSRFGLSVQRNLDPAPDQLLAIECGEHTRSEEVIGVAD